MFDRFFREAAALERLEYRIKAEAKQWIDEKDDSAKGTALELARKLKAVRRDTTRQIRRLRIKEWYSENHDIDFEDDRFDRVDEDEELENIESCTKSCSIEAPFARWTEGPEEREIAVSRVDSRQSLELMDETPDPADMLSRSAVLARSEMLARSALDELAYPRPESVYNDSSDDDTDDETPVDNLISATPPSDGPEFDGWESELEEEEETEQDDVEAQDTHQTENGPLPLVGDSDDQRGLRDWEEE